MDQYRPMYKAYDHQQLSRQPTFKEYTTVVKIAKDLGLNKGETFRHAFLRR